VPKIKKGAGEAPRHYLRIDKKHISYCITIFVQKPFKGQALL
jgi:hypothetical protein